MKSVACQMIYTDGNDFYTSFTLSVICCHVLSCTTAIDVTREACRQSGGSKDSFGNGCPSTEFAPRFTVGASDQISLLLYCKEIWQTKV